MKNFIVTILFLISLRSATAQNSYFPPITSSKWDTIAPATLGWNNDNLNKLNDFLDEKNTKAFIILKDSKIVVEWYFDQFSQDSLWYWASAGKSMTAFLIGMAQQEGFLKIEDKTSDYLGEGWSSCPKEKEDLITIRHQLTMTTGLNDWVENPDCTADTCLEYKADAGTRWAYHNAPYTLLDAVLESASGISSNPFTATRLSSHIGMTGLWLQMQENHVFVSNARSMARFGLLIQNNGIWDSDTLMYDTEYFNTMLTTSQSMNKSYGYLWWLNGGGSYMMPAFQIKFPTDLIPEAPDDLVAALGKNDQKIYVVNSLGLVVVRMGNATGKSLLALSSFDNDLWEKIMNLYSQTTATGLRSVNQLLREFSLNQNYPNPFNPATTISYNLQVPGKIKIRLFNVAGQEIETLVDGFQAAGNHRITWRPQGLSNGIYFCQMEAGDFMETRKLIFQK